MEDDQHREVSRHACLLSFLIQAPVASRRSQTEHIARSQLIGATLLQAKSTDDLTQGYRRFGSPSTSIWRGLDHHFDATTEGCFPAYLATFSSVFWLHSVTSVERDKAAERKIKPRKTRQAPSSLTSSLKEPLTTGVPTYPLEHRCGFTATWR